MGVRKMHIVHLGKYYPPAPGGIESHVRTLAQAQAAMGMRVQVLCINHVDRHGQDLTWRRHGSTPTRVEKDGPVEVTRLGRSMSAAKLDLCPRLPRLLRQLDGDGIDILHLHTPNPTMLLAVAMAGIQTPLIITHHSDIVRQRMLGLALRPFEWAVYGAASLIFSNSPVYQNGSRLLARYAEHVRTVPMGIDLRPYTSPSEAVMKRAAALRAEYGTPLWLSVGRCVYYKHYHVAIDALPHVPGKLMIVGHGPMKDSLVRQARNLGVADRLIWRDFMEPDELAAAYRAATALWFPSGARSEAYGLVQVEAMASGCPVLNADIADSGVPWVSQHEKTGLTFPVGDAGALAAAARRLAGEPLLREHLSRGAVERACGEFDQQTMAQRSIDLYLEVLHADRVLRLPVEHSRKRLATPQLLKKPAPTHRRERPATLDGDEEPGVAV